MVVMVMGVGVCTGVSIEDGFERNTIRGGEISWEVVLCLWANG